MPEIEVVRALPETEEGHVSVGFGDGRNLDASGRLRTSEPQTIWDSQFEYNAHPLFYDQITDTNGAVAHNAPFSSVKLTVTTDSGSTAILQSYEYFRYQPAKSQQVTMSFLMATAIASLDQRVGQFDANNGLFLEVTGTTVNLVRRTKTSGSVVNNKTPQASWNMDKMDGTGRSGIMLDLTKIQILHIDYVWLSGGRIRFGFEIDGVVHNVHQELIANTIAVPSMTTANLPIRWEMDTTGAIASESVMQAICVSIVSEGGQELQTGHPFSFGREAGTAANNTEEAFIGIRSAATLNSIPYRGKIVPLQMSLLVSGSDCRWRVRYVPTTLTDVSWQAPVAHSGVQTDIATTTIAGGIIVDEGFIASGQGQSAGQGGGRLLQRLPLTLDADGTQTLSIFLTIEGVGGTTTVSGSVKWEEIR